MHSKESNQHNRPVGIHQECPSREGFPVGTQAIIPVFRSLTAVQRDTFVAVIQLADSDNDATGMDVVSRVKQLGQSSSQQTIYRALSDLNDYGYLHQFDAKGAAQQYVPTRSGLAAFWRARVAEHPRVQP
ncbi:hypothetical protein [Halobacterium noricense]|uniref:hypothetical protein n=1 Tax=Halobacterium noricense TaxID=223182 RepID=UPI001E3C05E3|nr:hypothetical protein [Halobacterium noricense]UHH27255.1 hypothetical protein LT974_17590 [Halobacterium noricense]